MCRNCFVCFIKTISKISYLIIILWISLEKGECFYFNYSLGSITYRTSKGKICKTIITNDKKFDYRYLNKLLDQYNNAYHHSIGKKNY